LNHCRLSLQVTTLAEITDHTGQHSLTEAIIDGNKLPTLTNVSKSNYIWPNQPSPSQGAWKFWTKALRKLFTKPGLPNQLNRELGLWHPNASLHCTWHATFNTRDNAVYLHAPSTNPKCFKVTRTTCSYFFYHQSQTTLNRPTKYPLTIDPQRIGFRICLPISCIPSPATVPNNPSLLPTTILGKI